MGDKQAISLSFPHDDIALLTVDLPGKSANVLSKWVLENLSKHLDTLATRDDLQGLIIISGKPGTFIAGADLQEFAKSMDIAKSEIEALCRQGQDLFARLSACPFVTVAAIDGICVGGGTELTLWCDRRIATNNPKTEIGLPEVKLGLFPGWGGTARVPRMIGLGNAVEMITSGNSLSPEECRQVGLVSDVVSPDSLLDAAVGLVRLEHQQQDYLRDRERWSGPIKISDTELAFLGATASAYINQQTKGQYPAPLAALEVMLGGAGTDVKSACAVEAQGMASLFGSDINRSLLNIFFLTDRNKKDRGIDGDGGTAREIERASVIGAGIMGSGIAAANVKRRITAILTDVSEEAMGLGARRVMEEVAFNKATKKADPDRLLEYAPWLRTTQADGELGASDVVIEAIIENPEIKQKLYARLEPHLGPQTILATNTSTIPITRLAHGLQHPERFCGIHFFNPVRRMKLVEVIRGPQTDDDTIVTAVEYVKRLGKFPIVVQDGPGFLVNRLLFPYMNEALALLAEGVPIDQIERAAKKFGMPMGPLELYDMVGMDTALYAGGVMMEAFPERMLDSPILHSMVEARRLGRKSGKGFFSYENKKKRRTSDPEIASLLAPHVSGGSTEVSPELLTHRLFMPMLLEATRVLEEQLVRDARDVDLGLIFGIGFPPFKGGLLFWADHLGAPAILAALKPLEQFGPRFLPTTRLTDMAAQHETFYSDNSLISSRSA